MRFRMRSAHGTARTANRKRGMALFIVMAVILFLGTIAVSSIQTNNSAYLANKIVRENERADFLARGAVQIALLKLTNFPYEFVDATIWKRGEIYSADMRKGIPGMKPEHANIKSDVYYDTYVGYKWNETTKTGTRVNTDLQYLLTAPTDPFVGEGYVTFINLVSKQDPAKKKWINAVEIGAVGDETSEQGDLALGARDVSRVHTKHLTEFYRFNWVHVER